MTLLRLSFQKKIEISMYTWYHSHSPIITKNNLMQSRQKIRRFPLLLYVMSVIVTQKNVSIINVIEMLALESGEFTLLGRAILFSFSAFY